MTNMDVSNMGATQSGHDHAANGHLGYEIEIVMDGISRGCHDGVACTDPVH